MLSFGSSHRSFLKKKNVEVEKNEFNKRNEKERDKESDCF